MSERDLEKNWFEVLNDLGNLDGLGDSDDLDNLIELTNLAEKFKARAPALKSAENQSHYSFDT